jgi:hypothetical protein
MLNKTANFKFRVPEDSKHEDAGKQIEKAFDYVECENESEAIDYIAQKEWNLVDIVNAKILGLARSSAYQNATAVYRPSEVSPEEIKARMVRDFIRLGVSEEVAKAQVDSLLASQKSSE